MQRVGSRTQVMHGNAKQTSGGLKKNDLKYNKQGKIVSKKMSTIAKNENRLQKAGYTTKKGQFGAVRIMRGGSGNNGNLSNCKDICFVRSGRSFVDVSKQSRQCKDGKTIQKCSMYRRTISTKTNELSRVINTIQKDTKYNHYKLYIPSIVGNVNQLINAIREFHNKNLNIPSSIHNINSKINEIKEEVGKLGATGYTELTILITLLDELHKLIGNSYNNNNYNFWDRYR